MRLSLTRSWSLRKPGHHDWQGSDPGDRDRDLRAHGASGQHIASYDSNQGKELLRNHCGHLAWSRGGDLKGASRLIDCP